MAANTRQLLFKPTVVLLISLTAGLCFGLYLLRGAIGGTSSFQFPPSFFYVVPIIVPFVAFILARAERLDETCALRLIIDVVVVGLSVARMFTDILPVSGHSLFLTYAIFTSRSAVTVITASLVMLQVIYLKYFVWHDFVTSTAGLLLGALASYLLSRHFRSTMLRSPTPSLENRNNA